MNYNNTTISFTEEQYKLIRYLVNNNYELKYEELISEYPTKNSLKCAISRINKKLNDMLYIKAIKSKGYKLLASFSKNE